MHIPIAFRRALTFRCRARALVLSGALLGLVASPAEPSLAQPAGTPTSIVDIAQFAYQPTPLTVSAGMTVMWTNQDGLQHTVTSGSGSTPDGQFDAGALDPGASFSMEFDTPGQYSYHCAIHPFMQGTVTVQ